MSFAITIRYSNLGFRDRRDSKSIESLLPEFVLYLRDLYVRDILSTVNSRHRYRGHYEPESKEYLEYKKKSGIPDAPIDFSVLFDKAMTVEYHRRYAIIQIDDSLKMPESSMYVSKLLRLLEYGSEFSRPRPLIIPVKRDIEFNIRYYWDTFLEDRMGVPYDRSRDLR